MYYPEHIIEMIRESSDIVSLIGEYTTLTKKGNAYMGLCPFHNEKSPSFSVSEDKQLYYCFGCGAGGNTITFLRQKENMTFIEAIQYLAERAHIELQEFEGSSEEIQKSQKKHLFLQINKEAAKFFYLNLKAEQHQPIMDYFSNRGVSLEMIKRFGLGYSPSEYNLLYRYLKTKGYEDDILLESGLFLKSKQGSRIYDRFSSRIIFPIFDVRKNIVGFGGRVLDQSMPKYLNSPENMLFNKSNILYGLHLAKANTSGYFILVEGYMDVIAMHQAGFTQTVASLGTAFTLSHAKLLKRYTKEVVIMYDSDQAGMNATLKAIAILKGENIKIRVLQLEGGKDPDEYLAKYGKDHLEELIKDAKSDVWFEILRLESKYTIEIAEQKVMFLQELAKYLAQLSSSIEQSIYVEEICQKYDIEKNIFQAEMDNHYKHLRIKYRPQKDIKPLKTNAHLMSGEVGLLSALYHYPYVIKFIKAYIKADMFEEELFQDVIHEIFKAYEQHQDIDIKHLSKKYVESNDQNIISHIIMFKDERYEDQSVLQKMLLENIKRLQGNYIMRQMHHTKDAVEKQNLLQQKNALNKLYIDFING